MLFKRKRGWEVAERDITPESTFINRRSLIKGLAAGPLLLASGSLAGCWDEATANSAVQIAAAPPDPTTDLYPVERNPRYKVSRAITDEADSTVYNNFYEFGSHKSISRAAQALSIRPWTVTLDGMVEKPITIGIDDLIRQMPLEERVYRHRCVEAWSMVVPWSGFQLSKLVELAKPLSSAKYLTMQTFMDPDNAPGQKQHWYPWPYVEGLTMEEATNELAFMVTGVYGKPVPRQMGAPLRLAVPWKYGFKSIKSIVRFTFTDKRPVSFWEEIQGTEYGFWANVNPQVAHARWSQATERTLSGGRVPTQLYNGYGEQVAHLYKGMTGERLFT
ncbi:MAG: protein-methionine-sulfoxide reductase catalytic subunit MsrP [Proteobacteria bacterium]|nr:protein-methionine-sulfoxide reductase catalytic subunit MsrP [Pseudomonadota bacterium]MDA1310806.1 protein-methionine-sulfoxide reductase catalytic subunit MsrP [Pseudomonadota bacterium]